MQPLPPSVSTTTDLTHMRSMWLTISGLLYFLSGLAALIFPEFASVAIVQIISFLLIITGVASLVAAISGNYDNHRLMHGLLAFLRIAVGILILKKIIVGLELFTIILAAFFLIEGIFEIVTSVKLKNHKYWSWLLFNGIMALALGVIIFVQYPIAASWVIGLLYGVNAIFGGTALLLWGCGSKKLPDHL
ncbi:MAG: hypothetical protein C5B47_08770 [Verrucomicrobia bacterium]|nr:MAG: hypothetical protein C5B47_08770 [Verrucomicrobiota bacterium]